MLSKAWIAISMAIMLAITNVVATGYASNGTFTISIEGYLVSGQLMDVTGHQPGVKLLMSIDRSVSTTAGSIHIITSGVWNGAIIDSFIAGSIDNITGSVHACVSMTCENATFVGSGNWNGTLTALAGSPQGSGSFHATLQVPNMTNTIPVSGNWTSSFNI